MHEHTQKHIAEIKGSSDRTFGLVFTGFFVIVGLLPLLAGHGLRIWSLILATAIALISFLAPKLLAPANRLWTRFGLLLHSVVSPIALGLIFFLVVTPIGLTLRLLGKDPLRLRFEKDAGTYWIERVPRGPTGESLTNQF